jgi:hypothetical protein
LDLTRAEELAPLGYFARFSRNHRTHIQAGEEKEHIMNLRIQLATPALPLLIALVLLCPAAAGPQAQAVSPAPDGGYPGNNP